MLSPSADSTFQTDRSGRKAGIEGVGKGKGTSATGTINLNLQRYQKSAPGALQAAGKCIWSEKLQSPDTVLEEFREIIQHSSEAVHVQTNEG